ncbi:hypothetical protein VK91_02610 [Lysinibacillus sp. LK3]|nr:hypothetical protein VK91_02610 [Lysinibacillus sp. LK3]
MPFVEMSKWKGRMMDFIKDFIDNKYLWVIIFVIVAIAREYISTKNITDLEKKLMTDFQKFKYNASQVIFVNVPFLLFLGPILKIIVKENANIDEKNQNLYFWLIFIFSAVVIIGFTVLLHLLLQILIIKLDYIIETEEGIKVKIMRRVDDNSILVENNRNKKRLMNDWYNKDFIIQLDKGAIIHKILYAHQKRTKIVQIIAISISGISLVSTVIGILLNWTDIIQFLCFLTFLMTLVIFLVVYVNSQEYKRYETLNHS